MATTRPTHSLSAVLLSPFHRRSTVSLSLSPFPDRRRIPLLRAAAKPPSGPVEKPTKKKKKKPKRLEEEDVGILSIDDVEVVERGGGGRREIEAVAPGKRSAVRSYATPMPEPPAGFVVDEHGKVLAAAPNRIAVIVDPINNIPLECVVRRVFKSSRGDDCLLLCPVDTPVQMLKSKNIEGWSAVSDEEVESVLPAAAYALAKLHMHLVHSGFCYTARGGFCYTEDDIFDFRSDDGQDVDGLPTEGVEITCFHMDGAHYMIYTPTDPLLFVAVKGANGLLQIADDDLLEDTAVISAIDEETEFNALVEEEAALLDSLFGKE